MKSQGVGGEIIIPEDGPGPADDRIGMDVGAISKVVLLGQAVPETDDGVEIVDAKVLRILSR